tara:strand:+ start:1737 stop:2030 length:294 start_codon:yes stop_codon:yes gene_type:complete
MLTRSQVDKIKNTDEKMITRSLKRLQEKYTDHSLDTIAYKNDLSTTYNLKTKTNNNTVNFDEASKEWNKNKLRMGNGTYTYKTDVDIKTTRSGRTYM